MVRWLGRSKNPITSSHVDGLLWASNLGSMKPVTSLMMEVYTLTIATASCMLGIRQPIRKPKYV